jgi:hypothetical protein
LNDNEKFDVYELQLPASPQGKKASYKTENSLPVYAAEQIPFRRAKLRVGPSKGAKA